MGGVLQEFLELSLRAGAVEVGRGEDGVASGEGIAMGPGGAGPVGGSTDCLLLEVLQVHGVPPGEVSALSRAYSVAYSSFASFTALPGGLPVFFSDPNFFFSYPAFASHVTSLALF